MKKSHKVQSHRGLIERMFARLKKWEILEDGNIESIDMFEMELDCAMALQNLNERVRLGLMDGIPDRAPFTLDEHIITRDVEAKLSIPKPIRPENAKFPPHWKEVMQQMTSIVPDLQRILTGDPEIRIFSQRVLKRGENLFSGGNVVQIASQLLANDVIRFQARVYASMKIPCYTTFFEVQKGDGVIRSVCSCKNGYVDRVCKATVLVLCLTFFLHLGQVFAHIFVLPFI